MRIVTRSIFLTVCSDGIAHASDSKHSPKTFCGIEFEPVRKPTEEDDACMVCYEITKVYMRPEPEEETCN